MTAERDAIVRNLQQASCWDIEAAAVIESDAALIRELVEALEPRACHLVGGLPRCVLCMCLGAHAPDCLIARARAALAEGKP